MLATKERSPEVPVHPATQRPSDPISGDVARRALPQEYLSYRLGAEEYGIDILRVQEIRSYEVPTRIANAPVWIKGVVNLRGVIVPIIDLRIKLGCEQAEYNQFTVIIVMHIHGRVIGAVVDSVSDVLELTPEQIRPAPSLRTSNDADFVMGIGCVRSGDAERMLILTDIDALMSDPALGVIRAERAA